MASRRVTSVLFGDLVGFTTLSEGRDHEDVRELLSRYFETSRRIVERYGGVVEKFIGDAVMAVWGVPTAHEDDAERAVRAGLELVAAVAGLRDEVGVAGLDMRVGIVTGEVAVTVGAEGQGMVAGDAVNTAARVQSTAAPGQVWVDATTRSLTQRAVTFVDTGEHRLKGKAEPVPLWAVRAVVAGSGGNQRADGLEAPLVGRDRELRMIKEIFNRTGEQASPSLVILSGQPGVGKSRLAWEFEKYVDGLPATTKWHTGRCVAYGERMAYYALAEAIRARLRLTAGASSDPAGDAGPEDMAVLLSKTLDAVVPDDVERDWIAPRLGALLGVGSLGEFSRADLFSAWAAFLRRIGAGAESVVLQIDDAEHADEGLIGFVEHLLAARFPVFVLMMARPSLLEDHPQLARNPQTMLVNLAPLSDTDMQHLLDDLVAGLPESVRHELSSRSEGVPLYAVETVRSLIDRELVVPLDGRLVLADREIDLAAIGAPASLQALIAARLDALTETERGVVDAACILGQSFHHDHLEAMVAGPDPDAGVDLDAALSRLERGQLVVRDTNRWSGDFGQYKFVQAVVPQVAYSMLARRERKAAHLRAAEIFSESPDPSGELAPVIAEHLTRAADAVPDGDDVPELRSRALQQLIRAGERAEALGAIREADAYLRSARELADDPLMGAQIELRRGLALVRGQRYSAAAAVLQPLVAVFDEVGDDVAAGTAVGGLGESLVELGRIDEARDLTEPRWLAMKDRPGADDAVVQLAIAMASAFEGGDVRDYAEAVMRIARRRGDDLMFMRGLRMSAIYFYARGLLDIGRLYHAECARYDAIYPLARVINLGNLAASWMPEDVSRSADFGRQAWQLIDELQLDISIDTVLSNYATALFICGEWDDASQVVARREGFERPLSGAALDFVATAIAVARRDTVPSPQSSDSDLDEGSAWLRVYGLTERTARLSSAERREPVAPAVLAFSEYFDIVDLSDDHAVVWPTLFDLARAEDDQTSITALLDVIGEDETDESIPIAFRAHRHRALGLLAHDRGDNETATSRLRSAVELYDTWGSVPLAARTRAELGGALMRSDDGGDRSEGGALLEDARATFTTLRATAWLDTFATDTESVLLERH